MSKTIKVADLNIANDRPFVLMGGMNVLESRDLAMQIAEHYVQVTEKLGINRGVTDRRDKVVAHTLRHSFASWLAMDGVPIITIQKLMGHSDLSMTLRYAHLSPHHERQATMGLVDGDSAKIFPLNKREDG